MNLTPSNPLPNPIFPSILTTDYFNLESRLRSFETNGIEFIHLDVMDGHFVGNLSFGPSAVSAIKSKFSFRVDSHLMVDNPAKMIPRFIDAGSDWVSFHVEAVPKQAIPQTIDMVKQQDRKVGLVFNPDTPIEQAFDFLDSLDFILLMSVFPGYGGQPFISSTYKKVETLKERIVADHCRTLIQVDGGVKLDNVGALKAAGADLFVIGTFLYNSADIEKTLKSIRDKLNGAQS